MMNWLLLKEFRCPHCERALEHRDTIVGCTFCAFEMSVPQFKKRLLGLDRGQQGVQGPTWKWQNLHKEHCPMCGKSLIEGQGYGVLRCIDQVNCPFRITEDRLRDILNDPNHSANRYNQKTV